MLRQDRQVIPAIAIEIGNRHEEGAVDVAIGDARERKAAPFYQRPVRTCAHDGDEVVDAIGDSQGLSPVSVEVARNQALALIEEVGPWPGEHLPGRGEDD